MTPVTNVESWELKRLTVAYSSGPSVSLSTTTPSRTGYTFKGWSTASGASNTVNYDLDGSTTAPAATNNNLYNGYGVAGDTLYAVWQVNKYKLSIVENNPNTYGETVVWPTGAKANVDVDYGTKLSAVLPSLTVVGYTFDKWFVDANSNKVLDSGERVINLASDTMQDSALTVTASWTVNKFTLTIVESNPNTGKTVTWPAGFTVAGGQVVINNVSYGTLLSNIIPAVGGLTVEGYTHTAWLNVQDRMPNSTLTITADWTIKTFNLTVEEYFNTAKALTTYTAGETGGVVVINDSASSNEAKELVFSYGKEVYFHITEKAGYDIVGWFDSLVAGANVLSSVTKVSDGVYKYIVPDNGTKDIALFVKFAIQQYKLTVAVQTTNSGVGIVGGAVSYAQNIYFGETTTVVAKVNEGFYFSAFDCRINCVLSDRRPVACLHRC